jgi:Zn-dependent peptidase ImmA (M78 family)
MERYSDREHTPDFDAAENERANEPRSQLAREMARNLHKLIKATQPPVDINEVARLRKLLVVSVDIESKLSGALYPEKHEIVVNTRGRSKGRQRFTIAHELGHWEFRHWQSGDLPDDTFGYSGIYEGDSSSEGRSAVEREANAFAAELLMPSKWIRRLSKPLRDGAPQELASLYQVSDEAMFYQLMRCGRI